MTAHPLRALLGRIAWSAVLIFGVISITFFLIRAAPGDPLASQIGGLSQNADRAARLNLDGSVGAQYLRWLSGLAHGDLGESLSLRGQPVGALLGQGAMVSLLLAVPALFVALALAVVGAVWLATTKRATRRLGVWVATVGMAVPSFVLAPFLSLFFGVWLQLLPIAGYEPGNWIYLILPIIALALPQAAALFLIVSSSLDDVLTRPFVRTARSKGLARRTSVVRHALPLALLPLLSYLGPLIAGLILGTVVVETIFDIPGVGRLVLNAAVSRDHPLIIGASLVSAIVIVSANLLADILQTVLDPRQDGRPAP